MSTKCGTIGIECNVTCFSDRSDRSDETVGSAPSGPSPVMRSLWRNSSERAFGHRFRTRPMCSGSAAHPTARHPCRQFSWLRCFSGEGSGRSEQRVIERSYWRRETDDIRCREQSQNTGRDTAVVRVTDWSIWTICPAVCSCLWARCGLWHSHDSRTFTVDITLRV